MKVVVYGTLKRSYGNNGFLKDAKFVGQKVVENYRLHNRGFPVAQPFEGETILGELWDISGDLEAQTLRNLDRLEGEGRMYNRIQIEPDTYMYVGHPDFWKFVNDQDTQKNLCEKTQEGHYEWKRDW